MELTLIIFEKFEFYQPQLMAVSNALWLPMNWDVSKTKLANDFEIEMSMFVSVDRRWQTSVRPTPLDSYHKSHSSH